MKIRTRRGVMIAIALMLIAGTLPIQASTSGPNPFAQATATATTQQETAPSAGAPAASAAGKPHDDTFVIGNDDVLYINVWKETDLTRTVPVRSDGKIPLPLVGEMQATGRTPLQLEKEIAEKLKSFITTPEVTVIVQEIKSQSFNILGMVGKPGSYPLSSASTIVDAIAGAGGFKDFAKQKSIYILRQGAGGSQTRIPFNYKDFIKGKNVGENVKIEPHDTIVVP